MRGSLKIMRNIRKYNADGLFDTLNPWFEFPKNLFNGNNDNNIMQSDVTETDDDYQITVDLPGMDKKNIHLTYEDGILTISGKREAVKNDNDKKRNVIHQERSIGEFSRQYRLNNVDNTKIHAKYDNGILTVTLPKARPKQDNEITID